MAIGVQGDLAIALPAVGAGDMRNAPVLQALTDDRNPCPHRMVLVFWKTAGSLGLTGFRTVHRHSLEFGAGRAREPQLKSLLHDDRSLDR